MRVLVTGAAGLIGGELCARLVTRGHQVTALVHRVHAVIGNDRQPVSVTLLPGDVTRPGLGVPSLPPLDLIIHSAAVTAFDAPETLYRAVNIAGTVNVAALGVPMIQVSTAYVCGTTDGRIMEASTGTTFVNGYEASKAAAEAMVRASGTRFAIARPSVVVGAWATGAISRFENIYMIFKLIAEHRVRTLPAAAGASLDLVPIDHACAGITAMAEDFALVEGRTLHLVGATATPLKHLGAAIAAVPGLGAPHFVEPSDFAPETLAPTERRYHAAAAALYTSYLLRNPLFDTSIAATLVPPCPPTDRAWLDRLIAFALAQGFVAARPLTARQDTAPPASWA